MKGKILSIEDAGIELILQVVVPKPKLEKMSEMGDRKKREEFKKTEEYQKFLEECRAFESQIRMGEVELTYGDEV